MGNGRGPLMSNSRARVLISASAVFVAIGASLIGTYHSAWRSPWVAIGGAFLVVGAGLVIGTLAFWLRRGKSKPLKLRLERADWRNVLGVAWVFALEISFENRSDMPISLIQAYIETSFTEPRFAERRPMVDEDLLAISVEQAKLKSECEGRTFISPESVLVGHRITRTILADSYVPILGSGTPTCTVVVRDSLDNTHVLEIPAQPSQIYRWGEGRS
jgi:hypothetical protein